MPQFAVDVAPRDAGGATTIQIDAPTESDAHRIASSRGYVVGKVQSVDRAAAARAQAIADETARKNRDKETARGIEKMEQVESSDDRKKHLKRFESICVGLLKTFTLIIFSLGVTVAICGLAVHDSMMFWNGVFTTLFSPFPYLFVFLINVNGYLRKIASKCD